MLAEGRQSLHTRHFPDLALHIPDCTSYPEHFLPFSWVTTKKSLKLLQANQPTQNYKQKTHKEKKKCIYIKISQTHKTQAVTCSISKPSTHRCRVEKSTGTWRAPRALRCRQRKGCQSDLFPTQKSSQLGHGAKDRNVRVQHVLKYTWGFCPHPTNVWSQGRTEKSPSWDPG